MSERAKPLRTSGQVPDSSITGLTGVCVHRGDAADESLSPEPCTALAAPLPPLARSAVADVLGSCGGASAAPPRAWPPAGAAVTELIGGSGGRPRRACTAAAAPSLLLPESVGWSTPAPALRGPAPRPTRAGLPGAAAAAAARRTAAMLSRLKLLLLLVVVVLLLSGCCCWLVAAAACSSGEACASRSAGAGGRQACGCRRRVAGEDERIFSSQESGGGCQSAERRSPQCRWLACAMRTNGSIARNRREKALNSGITMNE